MSEARIPLSYFTRWLASGERGISSNAIVSHLTGELTDTHGMRPGSDHPWDPDDFRRCELLLTDYPLARELFGRMRSRSATWSDLVDEWGDIRELLDEECPGWLRSNTGSAPRAYQLMRRIREGVAENA